MVKLNITLGNTSLDQLKELRGKLKQAGAPELLSDAEWENHRSIIPHRTMRDLGTIPPSAGFARSAHSPRPTIHRAKASEPSALKVEPDAAFDEEFQLIPELTKVLEECLVVFPEVKDVEIRATRSTELSGCKGTHKGKPIIILFIPDQAWGSWQSLKPIILHELAHFPAKTSEETEKIFFERADEKSKELWRKLKNAGAINCTTDKI